jgi:hypothetical protein
MLEMKALAEATAMIVKEHVAIATAPLLQRIAALEDRPAPIYEPDRLVILQLVQDEIAKLPPAEPGEPGKDADIEQLPALVAEEVERAVAVLPVPKDGESIKGEPGEPGKDADPALVAALVAEEVERAVAALPPSKDGASVMVEDVLPDILDEVKAAVAALPEPRSVKNVIVNRSGEAVYTFSDGSTENIGQVAGKDGNDVDWAAVETKLRELVDAIPVPRDGKDGYSLSNFDTVMSDDGRTMLLSFEDDKQRFEVELKFPVPIYRGVFKEGTEYEAGDMVTWGGSIWHCKEATLSKPDIGPWQLAVKKGRDGKDSKS